MARTNAEGAVVMELGRTRQCWAIRFARAVLNVQCSFLASLGILCLLGGRDYRPDYANDPNIGAGLTVFGSLFLGLAVLMVLLTWLLGRGAWIAYAAIVVIEMMWVALALVGFTGLGLVACGAAGLVILLLVIPRPSREIFAMRGLPRI